MENYFKISWNYFTIVILQACTKNSWNIFGTAKLSGPNMFGTANLSGPNMFGTVNLSGPNMFGTANLKKKYAFYMSE